MGSPRPSILFMFTDDQRFDTIAALGNPDIRTPNLDRLVERGVAFTHAHIMGGSVPAVSMPSRAMLHTGRTLFSLRDSGREVPEDHALLGEVLRRAGYETFGTGKWHNGPASYHRSFSSGAEIYFGGMADHWNVPAHSYDPSGRYEGRLPRCVAPHSSNRVYWMTADHVHAGRHSTDPLADSAAEFLRSADPDRPYFAYVSFLAPHDPRTMPREYLEMYDPKRVPLPANYMPEHPFDNGEMTIRDEKLEAWPRTPEAVRRHTADYYAMITHLDDAVGRVVKALEDSGRAEETIVVFAGDNGLAVGRHGLMGKQNLYEHSVRVPLVMAGPGLPGGERRSELCYLSDLFPTLAEAAGVDVPQSVQGLSLMSIARGGGDAAHHDLYLAYRGVQRGLREERWKLMEYRVAGERRAQLFDTEADPWETNDVSRDPAAAGELKRLQAALARSREEYEDTGPHGRAFWGG